MGFFNLFRRSFTGMKSWNLHLLMPLAFHEEPIALWTLNDEDLEAFQEDSSFSENIVSGIFDRSGRRC